MAGGTRIVAILFALSALGIGCAAVGPRDSSGAVGASAPSSRATLKRITLRTAREQDFRPNTDGPQRLAFQLVHTGLTVRGDQRIRHPRLAEVVPSLDNGLWKLLPDGRMETTWRIRDGARWHDGAPVPGRIQTLGQVIRHMADQVTFIGLYYNPQPGAISDRVLNVGKEWPLSFITWNAHEWDVRS